MEPIKDFLNHLYEFEYKLKSVVFICGDKLISRYDGAETIKNLRRGKYLASTARCVDKQLVYDILIFFVTPREAAVCGRGKFEE